MKKNKQPEKVIPFAGEETFIVNRESVDDTDWQYVTAQPPTPDGTGTIGGVLTIMPTLPQLSQINAMGCPELQSQISLWKTWESQFANATDKSLYAAYQEIMTYANTLYNNKCTVQVQYPYPDWKTLDCAQATAEVKKLQDYINATTFPDAATKQKAQSELLVGIETQAGACAVKPAPQPQVAPAPTTTVTSTTQLIPSVGAFGGGFGAPIGGGGGGASEEGETTPLPEKKSNWLLWLLLIGGGLYLITRKKKKP